MKAIETTWNGLRFRSRLEARWAIFFEVLGLKWEYEPEGFEMSSGRRYLPDFKVRYPGQNFSETSYHWFEVKPNFIGITTKEWEKMADWSRESGDTLFMLDDVPSLQMYVPLHHLVDLSVAGTVSAPTMRALEINSRLSRDGFALWSYKKRLWWDVFEDFFISFADFMVPDELVFATKYASSFQFGIGQ
jgi:hypothetical protein